MEHTCVSKTGVTYLVEELWALTQGDYEYELPPAVLWLLIRERLWKNSAGAEVPALQCLDPWHLRKIANADMTKPIILHEEGWLMDGAHRCVGAIRANKSLKAIVITAKRADIAREVPAAVGCGFCSYRGPLAEPDGAHGWPYCPECDGV